MAKDFKTDVVHTNLENEILSYSKPFQAIYQSEFMKQIRSMHHTVTINLPFTPDFLMLLE